MRGSQWLMAWFLQLSILEAASAWRSYAENPDDPVKRSRSQLGPTIPRYLLVPARVLVAKEGRG